MDEWEGFNVMPITPFTAVGSSLVADIISANFGILRSYLLESIVGNDINDGVISRWTLLRNSGGRLSTANILAKDVTDFYDGENQAAQSYHEVTYYDDDQLAPDLLTTPVTIPQRRISMEFLGKPGPSFWWDWQEEGLTYVGSTNPGTYSNEYCYSYWLTVPFASKKLYVPHGCVAKLYGFVYYLGALTAVADYYVNGPAGSFAGNQSAFRTDPSLHGRQISMQLGLFVDTNPTLHSDEFVNNNPNVVDPITGAQASRCTWKMVTKKTVHSPQWQRENIEGVVVLNGGKWYNFSMKYRLAGWVGHVGEGGTFIDGIYEYDKGSPALPNYNGTYQRMAGLPPFEIEWISTSLDVEFFNGYSAIYDNSANIGITP